MKKFLKSILTVAAVGFCFWVLWSYVDITSHNQPFSESYKSYSSYNFFIVLENLMEG